MFYPGMAAIIRVAFPIPHLTGACIRAKQKTYAASLPPIAPSKTKAPGVKLPPGALLLLCVGFLGLLKILSLAILYFLC